VVRCDKIDVTDVINGMCCGGVHEDVRGSGDY
jgi:hypothetical protein